MSQKQKEKGDSRREDYSLTYIFKHFGVLRGEVWQRYLVDAFLACLTGMVHPSFGIVYARANTAF